MDKTWRIVKIRLEGRGCRGCVLPAKRYFFGLPGVRGVHVRGYYVYLYLDKDIDPRELVRMSGVEDYYVVREIVEGDTYHDHMGSVSKKYSFKSL